MNIGVEPKTSVETKAFTGRTKKRAVIESFLRASFILTARGNQLIKPRGKAN